MHREPVTGEAKADYRVDARTTMPPHIDVRPVHTYEEFTACVALQEATWGESFTERVPAAILKVSQRIGGVTAGAFEPGGRLVGFVFGMTGVEKGRLVHWSDMLAVARDQRDHGIGRRLKEFQRDTLIAAGVELMCWSFDPLVARNAHFNISRLGARVTEYVVDMYGSNPDSSLHRGLGTDRFVVAWDLRTRRDDQGTPQPKRGDGKSDSAEPPSHSAAREAPVLNPSLARAGSATLATLDGAPILRLRIPADIHRVQADSVQEAAAWRASTRHAFSQCFAAGYHVAGFYRDDAAGFGYYVLTPSTLPVKVV